MAGPARGTAERRYRRRKCVLQAGYGIRDTEARLHATCEQAFMDPGRGNSRTCFAIQRAEMQNLQAITRRVEVRDAR